MNDDHSADPKKQRRVRGSGSIFRKGNNRTWTLQYYKDDPATGKRVRFREYTGLTSRTEAQKLLTTRLYQVDRGELFETRRLHAVRIEDLYAALKEDTLNNSRSKRGAEGLGWRWEHLKPAFGNVLAANLTTDAISAYIRQRQTEGAANATINRELATLRRAFNLGRRCTPPKVRVVPYFPMLKEDNVRRGFVEDADFSKMTAEASELWLRTFLEMAYTYGWRRSELLGLRVRQVNLSHRTIRLDTGTTKNGEGREVRMTPKIADLLRAAISGKKADDYVLTRANGKPVSDFRGTWDRLCIRAGLGSYVCAACGEPWPEKKGAKKCACGGTRKKYAGLIVHDFRRSAAKAARRAGVPESVIMATGGWKTPAMFRRYAIVSSADQRDFVEKIERARSENLSPRSAPFSMETTTRPDRSADRKVQ